MTKTAMGRSAALALLCAGAAAAQDPGLRVTAPFAPGERWALRERLVTHELPLGEPRAAAEVSHVEWRESAEVLGRAQGFALRVTLESLSIESSAEHAESRLAWNEEDLRRIQVGPDREVPFARAWTLEYDPTCRLLAVSGHRKTMAQLYDRLALELVGRDADECSLRAWLVRVARPWVVDRWSRRVEELLAWSNEAGAPVHVVMARLRDGGGVGPGFEAAVPATSFLPAGTVRWAGRDEQGARFRFEPVGGGSDSPSYTFVVDEGGRLARLETVGTEVRDGKRVTTDYLFVLERVEAAAPAAPPGIDAERDPVDEQRQDVGPRPPRGQPF